MMLAGAESEPSALSMAAGAWTYFLEMRLQAYKLTSLIDAGTNPAVYHTRMLCTRHPIPPPSMRHPPLPLMDGVPEVVPGLPLPNA